MDLTHELTVVLRMHEALGLRQSGGANKHYESLCEKLGNLSESCVLDNSLAFISLFPYRCKIEGRYVIPYSEIQLNFSKTRNQHSATKVNICFDKHKPDYGKVSVYPEVPSSLCPTPDKE